MNRKTWLSLLLACLMLSTCLIIPASALRGDVTGDNDITALDYLVLKKYVLEQMDLNDAAVAEADYTGDGAVDARDYILLKRAFLNESFKINIIKDVIKENGALSRNISGTLASYPGEGTVSLVIVGTDLVLRGHATTNNGITVDLDIPLNSISATYSFSGTASKAPMSGKASGTITAATYSVLDDTLDVTLDTGAIVLPDEMKNTISGVCKELIDRLLWVAATELLVDPSIPYDLDIRDFGFQKLHAEVLAGAM